jgi:hypothetical protein
MNLEFTVPERRDWKTECGDVSGEGVTMEGFVGVTEGRLGVTGVGIAGVTGIAGVGGGLRVVGVLGVTDGPPLPPPPPPPPPPPEHIFPHPKVVQLVHEALQKLHLCKQLSK